MLTEQWQEEARYVYGPKRKRCYCVELKQYSIDEILNVRTLERGLGSLSGDGAKFRSGARSYFAEAFSPFSQMARTIRTESVFKEKSRGGAIRVIGRKE